MPRFRDCVCEPGSALHPIQEKVRQAIKARGFDRFKMYLSAHGGCTLREMADDLEMSCSAFISYHTRWVEENAPK